MTTSPRPHILTTLAILLAVATFLPVSLPAQSLIQEVQKTFSDGKPEIIFYYNGAKTEANKVKMEQLDRYGKTVLVEHYQNGKLHGKVQKKFHEYNGKSVPIIEENYQNGLLHGTQTTWFYNRKVQTELNYSQGLLDGSQTERFDQDNIRYQLTYKNGKPEGIQKEWNNSSGTQKYELVYLDGKLHGKQRWWNYSGELTEEIWEKGVYTETSQDKDQKQEKDYIFVLDSGSVSLDPKYSEHDEYKVLIRETWFHENGKAAKQQDLKPKLWYKQWYASGQLETEGAGKPFMNKTGIWGEYHENGQKRAEGEYEKDKKEGIWNNWNEKGWLISEETYEWHTGLKATQFYNYYPDGKKRSHGGITRGHKDGHWEYFRADGKKYRDEIYKPGPYSGNRYFIKEFTEWYPDGKVKLEGNDGKANMFHYASDGSKTAETQLVYKKTRGRHEYLEDGKLTINPKYAEKSGGGEFLGFAWSEGFPLQMDIFYPGGKQKATYRFCKNCTFVPKEELKELNETVGKTCKTCPAYTRAYERLAQPAIAMMDGKQEGWYENGQQRYAYDYNEGCLEGETKEWRSDGSQIYIAAYRHNRTWAKAYQGEQCATICENGTWYKADGKAYEYTLEWAPKSYTKAQETGDYSFLEAKEKPKKVIEIDAEAYLTKFQNTTK